ncbi:GNAT family N-acetyltransferase [Ureibacillus chungkukjangi]|uniref:Acetyltransferase (GNAT) family protein n=1 Tax=Ureibacillus chungkukjangi TaxID=1202712 RepID=A0A318TN15_9BACL|nr:GNAT family N-acetyltransferase [Ureibacillus chungkukjangi]MCM3388567.1 GNAT family N-acetyltransferase [Ureibacillus chungkukjangi]PYF05883.1 acetyltransferase (GNAT) family protein [Ureibacillus chungkukjangi]
MCEIEIRRPKIDEQNQIYEFFNLVITHTYQKEGLSELKDELNDEIETKKKFLADDFASKGGKRFFLFAYDENQIIGSIAYGEPNSILVEVTKGQLRHIPEVGSMLVHPHYQNQGIGNMLLQAIYQALRNKGISEFCFDSGYQQAQIIWTKKFGTPLVFLENYWGENSHHMIWRKNLADV